VASRSKSLAPRGLLLKRGTPGTAFQGAGKVIMGVVLHDRVTAIAPVGDFHAEPPRFLGQAHGVEHGEQSCPSCQCDASPYDGQIGGASAPR